MQMKILGITVFDDKKYLGLLKTKESCKILLGQLYRSRKINYIGMLIIIGLFALIFIGGMIALIISTLFFDQQIEIFSSGLGFLFLFTYFTQLIITLYIDLEIKIVQNRYLDLDKDK